jgi:hypothetical protein
MSNESYIQVPPDGAGKKISTTEVTEVHFENETTTINVGDVITGLSSGGTGAIIGIERENTSEFYLLGEHVFTAGETLQVSGGNVATVSAFAGATFHTQGFIQQDPVLHHHKQRIDSKGAASIRFSEGQQLFDAFGKSQVSQQTPMGSYLQTYDRMEELFWTDINGVGSSAAHDPLAASDVLSVGTVSGGYVHKTSHKYHIYQPGLSQNIIMTTSLGDSGKTGVCRRWGYFDVSDGVFFELNDTTLNVVIRSSVSGSIVETRIPQSLWSEDKVDGSTGSAFNLDVTMGNIYWIDFQWLGVGRVRFGTAAPDGTRITCHVVQNAGTDPRPYMRSGTLPIRYEIENLALSASPSTMRIICATVACEGEFAPHSLNFGAHTDAPIPFNGTDYVPLLSFRSAKTFNGLTNRIAAVLRHIDINVTPTVGTGSIRVSLVKNSTLTGPDWAYVPDSESSMEVDRVATGSTVGEKVVTWLAYDGYNHEGFAELMDYLTQEYIRLSADGTTQDEFTIRVKANDAAGEGTAFCSISWLEYRG